MYKHISLLNKSLKLSRKFHEDLVSVLNYILELDSKYNKHKIAIETKFMLMKDSNNQDKSEEARQLIGEIIKQCEGVEHFQKFTKNFNDAWEKVR